MDIERFAKEYGSKDGRRSGVTTDTEDFGYTVPTKYRVEFQTEPEELQELKNTSGYPFVDNPGRIEKIACGKTCIMFKPALILPSC